MQSTNLLHLPAAGTPSAKLKRADSKPAEQPHDLHVTLAEMLPQFVADREAAEAALSAIHDREAPRFGPRVVSKMGGRGTEFVSGPTAEELESQRRFESRQRHDAAPAKRHLEACRDKEAASYFARESIALRAAIVAAAPAIEAGIVECKQAVDREQGKVRDSVKATSDLQARHDALQVQREGLSSRQSDVEKAQARLASASDAGDDVGAESAAREIARIRRELVEITEPLELRLQATHDAVERAEVLQAKAAEHLDAAEEALRRAELDRLKLARDEAAMTLRDRDVQLWTAGYTERASIRYDIGLAPQVLAHLGGRPQQVNESFLEARGKERRVALKSGGPNST